ncbi:MAG TPA: hypothetical protein DF480_01675 [Clostridiales bacterium]|nr:hypothetical protein [Clostridiales bacterium]
MKKIGMTDATLQEMILREKGAVGFKEKIEIVRMLDKIRIDVIQIPFPADEKVNELLIKTVAPLVRHSFLCCNGGLAAASIDSAWKAMKDARKPMLRIGLPVSAIRMEYGLGRKPLQVLELIAQLVDRAASHTKDVDFVAEDATTAEWGFLCETAKTAVKAGASVFTIEDSAGTMLPPEFGAFIERLRFDVPELSGVQLGVCFNNRFRMSEAACLAAVDQGADVIRVSTGGQIAAGMETMADIIEQRGESIGLTSGLAHTQVQQAAVRIRQLATGSVQGKEREYESTSGVRIGALLLKEGDSLQTVGKAAKDLGYDLSAEERKKVYEAFQRLVHKKEIGAKELEAIIANEAIQVPPTYQLKSYVINNGNLIRSTAHIILEKTNGKATSVEGFAVGDGPIEAAFRAIEQIVGRHFELDEFQIQAVTEGREAMGDTLVKLRAGGKLYSGKGISTDIIGAGISAYLSAVNKIVFEENVS